MATRTVGIIINGATSGICNRQHLQSALVPIIREGGIAVGGDRVLPRLLLVGRDAGRLEGVASRFGIEETTTDLEGALADDRFEIFFDAGITSRRAGLIEAALNAGKDVYAEKPVVTDLEEGTKLLALANKLQRKHGVVEDKLFLPGLVKLRQARDAGLFGKVVGFRLDFGYWIFSGHGATPMQRPSWNYRKADGGGLMLDMSPHWRYIIEGILGPVRRVVCKGWTSVEERVDEEGRPFKVDVDDSTVALVELESGAIGVITSSWATRVARQDLLTLQVDGLSGSAVAGLHRCRIQPSATTPKVKFDPNVDLGVDYASHWQEVPGTLPFANGYRVGWEAFIRHVVAGAPKAADLSDGLRDVALAQAMAVSAAEERWVDMSEFAST